MTDFVSMTDEDFGELSPITVKRGKAHECLGMTLDHSAPGKVQAKMLDCVDNVLQELPVDMRCKAATPAPEHSFDVNQRQKPLEKEDGDMFHHNVAKALFLSKRAHPDTQAPMAFLCTRVKGSDIEDCKKQKRMMQCLRATRHLALTLEASNPQVIKWWVDAFFVVHQAMRNHTGGVMSSGRGTFCSTSTRQKINDAKSFTKAEPLVGADDAVGQPLWTRHFPEAQGWDVTKTSCTRTT